MNFLALAVSLNNEHVMPDDSRLLWLSWGEAWLAIEYSAIVREQWCVTFAYFILTFWLEFLHFPLP